MGREIDLLANYPKVSRNIENRLQQKTDEIRRVARKFDQEYFDGDRIYGYGGFRYNSIYWTNVVQDLILEYGLTNYSTVLDVGCAKGFFLYDLKKALPGIDVVGIDISKYAIENALPEIREYLVQGDAKNLPFGDAMFDLVISINTIHNLDREGCKQALQEIQRVTRKHSFITVDAYRNLDEKIRMESWNLTALTMMSDAEWRDFFTQAGYKGDYFWFIP